MTLYCRCAYAKVVPEEVKDEVLAGLVESGTSFECVPDLCEMAARQDPQLAQIAEEGGTIIACHPRAVKGLFRQAGTPLTDKSQVLNMREQAAEVIVEQALES